MGTFNKDWNNKEEGLSNIWGFNAFVKGWHPSFFDRGHADEINVPIRMGRATILPGYVVLANGEE